MHDSSLADRIEAFVATVGQYIQWTGVRALTFKAARPCVLDSPAEKEQLHRLEQTQHRVGDAAAAIRRDGPGLAAAVTTAGIDPAGVLQAVHCASGGGAEAIAVLWPDAKVKLQAAALGLRNPHSRAAVTDTEALTDHGPELTKEIKAVVALKNHPDWSDAEIAKAVGCSRTSLYRMKTFQNARELNRQDREDLPQGTKDSETGDIEAWDNPQDDE